MTESYPPVPPSQIQYQSIVPKRPTSVTALSIVSIVLGSIGVLGGLFGFAANAIMLVGGGRNRMMGTAPAMPLYITITSMVEGLCFLIFAVVMLVGGISALSLKPFARRLMINWAVAGLIFAVARTLVAILWIGPATVQWIAKVQPNNPVSSSGMMSAFVIGGAIVNLILYSTLPILFLVLWRRPNVRAAFGETAV